MISVGVPIDDDLVVPIRIWAVHTHRISWLVDEHEDGP